MPHDVTALMPVVARMARLLHLEETAVFDRDDIARVDTQGVNQ